MANVVAMEGFDGYGNSSSLAARWPFAFGSTATFVTGPYGGNAVRLANTGIRLDIDTSDNEVCVGFDFYHEGGDMDGTALLWLASGGVGQVGIVARDSGALRLVRGSTATVIDTSDIEVWSYRTWHHLEMRASIANSGGTVTVYIDGQEVINFTGDTQNNSTDQVNQIYLSGNTTVSIDNFWVTYDTVGIGSIVVETMFPIGDEAGNNWTPSTGAVGYAMIDEVPPTGDTDYVQGPDIGYIDLYSFGNPTRTADPLAVQIISASRKIDTVRRSYVHRLKMGSTEVNGATFTLTTGYFYYTDVWNVNPDTTLDWTNADVNALIAGLEVVAAPPLPNPFRYYRIFVSADNGAGGLDCEEIQMRIAGVDQCTGGTASASSAFGGLPASNAFDNTANRWASDFTNAWPQWIKYDFGAGNEKTIDDVTYKVSQATSRGPRNFSVQGSDDDSTWYDLFTGVSVTWSSSTETKTWTLAY